MAKKRVLITGITGFAGSHLAELLLQKKNVKVYGTTRWRSKLDNIQHILNKINLRECDIRDATSVNSIVKQIKPDYIFHLAAQSFVPTSWHAPQETLTTNIVGNLNVLEAVRHAKLKTRIQIACSSEEYGRVEKNELPIREENPLRPLSPYAVSKVAQDLLSYQYAQSYDVDVVRTRAFNHSGPRRGDVFVDSNFALQIARIEKGKHEPVIHVGNLEAKRDFTDVRDIVKAYWLSLEKGKKGEVYNICSGKSYTIKKVLDILLSYTKAKISVKVDPLRLRPSDVPVLQGNCDKFKKQTGWKTTISYEQTLKDMLNYWRERV